MFYLFLSVHDKLKYKSAIRKMKTNQPSYLIFVQNLCIFFNWPIRIRKEVG